MNDGKKLKAISFFSGAMGLDLGLEKAGIEIVLACENNKFCRKTISLNKPTLPLLDDINNYSASDIKGILGSTSIDIMIGGPPCQPFSTAGKRKSFNDGRGNIFLKFIELALQLKPQYLVIENVRGILSAAKTHIPHKNRDKNWAPSSIEEVPGSALLHILNILRSGGYGVSFNLYNAANFGTPQIRERVVIICCLGGIKLPHLSPTHSENGEFGLPKWQTFRDAVNNLTDCDHVNFPEQRLKYFRMLAEGQNWKNLPEYLQREALGKSYSSGGGKTGFLRRLSWNKPSCTLVTAPNMPATDMCHPTENRPLSIQEYKRLQEFPDNWQLSGKLVEMYRQAGNAVPVGLGVAIGNLLVSHYNGDIDETDYSIFPYSRYKNCDEVSWENITRKEIEKLRSKEYSLNLL